MNTGLSMGADLYVTKPFSTRELMAKIKGCLIKAPGRDRREGEAKVIISASSGLFFDRGMLRRSMRRK